VGPSQERLALGESSVKKGDEQEKSLLTGKGGVGRGGYLEKKKGGRKKKAEGSIKIAPFQNKEGAVGKGKRSLGGRGE